MVCGRAAQVEDVVDPVRQDRQRVAGHEEAVAADGSAQAQFGVVGGGPADEDRDIAPGEAVGRPAGILEGPGATSSSTRCCGSISAASRGEMPKAAASKPAASPIVPAAKV